MEEDDKKPSTLQKVVENLTHPTSTNIREVDFKKNPNDIVQTLGADTDAILITFMKEIKAN